MPRVFIQLNEATNHIVHISNHGARITFIAPSEALKGGFIMTYIYNIEKSSNTRLLLIPDTFDRQSLN